MRELRSPRGFRRTRSVQLLQRRSYRRAEDGGYGLTEEIAAGADLGEALVAAVIAVDQQHPASPSYHVWAELSSYLVTCGWTTTELIKDLTMLTTDAVHAMPESKSSH